MKRALSLTIAAATLGAIIGCQSAYYGTMERFGVHKRDILVDKIDDARDDQEEAKEQFKTALERFGEVVAFDGGELKSIYNRLQAELDRSAARAKDVRQSISKVEDVSTALFKEWEKEIGLYSSNSLRRESTRKLDETRNSYDQLIRAMKRAEASLEPVLIAFRDQVLFLKHNLNSQAISSLQDELVVIESDVTRLVQEMETSIAEADAFIKQLSIQ